jgi:small multidrug resistance pump
MHSLSWFYLVAAILFGVFGTLCLKLSGGLQKWKPTLSLSIFYLISFVALTLALQGIDMSIVYAVWSGVGTVLVAIVSHFVISLLLIVIGVFGIHLTNAFH